MEEEQVADEVECPSKPKVSFRLEISQGWNQVSCKIEDVHISDRDCGLALPHSLTETFPNIESQITLKARPVSQEESEPCELKLDAEPNEAIQSLIKARKRLNKKFRWVSSRVFRKIKQFQRFQRVIQRFVEEDSPSEEVQSEPEVIPPPKPQSIHSDNTQNEDDEVMLIGSKSINKRRKHQKARTQVNSYLALFSKFQGPTVKSGKYFTVIRPSENSVVVS
eukprot:TRINITY_DN6118_c0_g1_i3.p1 TRINITY_DN6118_c0_g1~~TRINITY_DN6118_c0_g1_i3.p1  ORF type:complete len:222 (+),score=35.74 TRINITY_DN6118_c0_g1_i3:257-922(+)